MKLLHMVAFGLLIVGGLNWGAMALLNVNLVTAIVGTGSLAKVVYALVGLSAVYLAATHMNECKACSVK